jgi:hypothetical protein
MMYYHGAPYTLSYSGVSSANDDEVIFYLLGVSCIFIFIISS